MKKLKFTSDIIFDILEVANDTHLKSCYENFLYGAKKEVFEITTNKMAKDLDKPIGKYELLTIKPLKTCNDSSFSYYASLISDMLLDFLKNIKSGSILVVGLGNKNISADALGSFCIKNLNITRSFTKDKVLLCGICPSVLGLTGIESQEIVKGVVDNINPSVVITIDSLCASSISRLGTSLQIHDGGITPGEGINNIRKTINRKSINRKVISIGVPLMVYASTILQEKFDELDIKKVGNLGYNKDKANSNANNSLSQNNETNNSNLNNKISQNYETNNSNANKNLDQNNEIDKINKLVDYVYNFPFNDIVVTLKDIEENVNILSKLIGLSINKTVEKLNKS